MTTSAAGELELNDDFTINLHSTSFHPHKAAHRETRAEIT